MDYDKQRWLLIKAKLQIEFVTLVAAAKHFQCSDRAFLLMSAGLCPRLAKKVCAHFKVSSLDELVGEGIAA